MQTEEFGNMKLVYALKCLKKLISHDYVITSNLRAKVTASVFPIILAERLDRFTLCNTQIGAIFLRQKEMEFEVPRS